MVVLDDEDLRRSRRTLSFASLCVYFFPSLPFFLSLSLSLSLSAALSLHNSYTHSPGEGGGRGGAAGLPDLQKTHDVAHPFLISPAQPGPRQ